jgi:putative ABC transport system permease protein
VSIRDTIRIALRALFANPLRAVLTTLGIIIGVAAVITTVSIGTGAAASIQQQITALGTNLLTVFPGRIQGFGGISLGVGSVQTLKMEDAEAVGSDVPAVEAVSAELSRSAQIVAGGQNDNVRVSGVMPSFPAVRNWSTTQGSFFLEDDMRSRARVAVIGSTVASTFYPEMDPVGQTLRINRVPFTVIGVMQTKGSTPGPQGDQDNQVFVPLTTAQRRLFGTTSVGSLYIKVREAGQMSEAVEQVRSVLRARHSLRSEAADDFTIRNQADLVQTFQNTMRTITMLLSGVAAISLLVGGIGIMNIMLVSVTERIREIGIRKAVGGTRRDVLLQFLVEAVLLSSAGGAMGIALGFLASRSISAVAGWSTIVTPQSVLLASGVAAAVGIFFGLYPAQRAAGLDPITALRHE